MTVALVLLGLGWSASTVSGSALVSDLVTGEARVRVQGRTDTIMSLAGAVGGASAGPVLALLGYAGVGDHGGAKFGPDGVAIGVIAMVMGVEDVLDGLFGDLLEVAD